MTAHEQETTDLLSRIDGLQAAVAALEKQVGRAGREQLRANALAETQSERLSEALAALRAAEERHAADLQAAQARTDEARLSLARAIFPVVDGLDEALRAGEAMLAHTARETPDDLLRRLILDADPGPAADGVRASLAAWLEGLTIVRRRLFDALAAEGVTPIPAEGLPFDPRQHLAVEAVAAAATPGTIVAVVRRGFLAGARVLRHAEVVVAAGA